ncbi:TIGR02234 family membrane protein [Streptomyces sulphureus]|uniref:TIGR02234 family membrane protein n=1 Tax=Streptomyces sulphureus TaxID=47758 RepID=UPI0003621425|nr:TIGR02234 family membrane protein [Streptomyces sulphureus]
MTSLPHARTSEPSDAPEPGEADASEAEPAPDEAPGRTTRSRAARRALGVALLAGAVGAALALLAAGQTWSESATSFARGRVPVSASGGDVTGLPSALALVGLAALVAVFAVRRAGRFLVSGLLALCGAGVVVSALTGMGDDSALREEAAETSGLAESAIGAVSTTPWPYLSAAGGLLILLAGLLALVYGRNWPSMSGSSRYERTSRKQAPAAEVDPERPEDLWKALDRGEDPT